MAFSEKSEQLVKDLIQAEYENACEQAKKEFNDNYIDRYHSLYEGYAILKEEVEEASVCVDSIKSLLDSIWDRIKKNLMTKDTYIAKQLIDRMLVVSADEIKELAQVGAVLMKIKNTIGEVEE